MDIKATVEQIAKNAKESSRIIRLLTEKEKNNALKILSNKIIEFKEEILFENKKDIENAKKNSLSSNLINRLTLNPKSIEEMSKSIAEIITLPDPIGKVLKEWKRPNGLEFQQISVPIGVIGVIYESRPNVTIDASCIAIKSGNTIILRGGSDSFNSSNKLVEIINKSFEQADLPKNAIQMIPTVNREAVDFLLKMNDYIDIIIPRGGKKLIETAKNQDRKVGVFPINDDNWIDVGQWAEYKKAVESL